MSGTPEQRRQTQTSRKVKTGCKTCKARRVKCDESRPACRRCVSTRRICDGYGIWGGGGSPYGQPKGNQALSVYCTPIPVGSLKQKEQSYFDWYMKRTTTKFTGLFTSEFWETLVFQASAQETCVRHAVIALSAAHRHEQTHHPWAIPVRYDFDMEQFVLQHYNKAIHALRANTTTNSKYSLRVALITCMIFVVLEYLRGQYQMGSAHLRYGIQLLASISAPKSPSAMSPNILSPAEDFAHKAIINSYSRLSIQAAMFGHVPSYMCIVTRDPQDHALPYRFASMVDARQTFDDLLNRVHCLKRHFMNLQSSRTLIDDEIFETRKRILEDLSLWRKVYDISAAQMNANGSPRDRFGYLLLRVYHHMATIMASVCLSSEGEMIFDSYTDKFSALLTSFIEVWSLWANMNIQTKYHKDVLKASACGGYGFTVELGYIPPLFYTALKCRAPRMRRQAVWALRSAPHREGVWNGPILADVLEAVIRLEENGIYAGDSSIDEPIDLDHPAVGDPTLPVVPCSARISDVSVTLPQVANEDTFISYKRRLEDGTWQNYRGKVETGSMREP